MPIITKLKKINANWIVPFSIILLFIVISYFFLNKNNAFLKRFFV